VTPLRVASLFCGIGGLDLGFEREGFEVVWANDLLHSAADAYAKNFGRPVQRGDLMELPLGLIPEVDVIIGGPPCQSFSLVGRRDPLDPRGSLVFRFRDIVDSRRPRAFVMENVPGMAASRVGGRRLTDLLLEDFDAMGYRVALLQLLATDYLVPQRRRRIFLVGSFDRAIGPPDAGTFALRILGRRPTAEDVSARAAIGDLGECGQRGARVAYADDPQSAFARLMRPKGTDDVTLHECPRMSIRDREFVRHIPPGGNYRDIPDRVATPRIMKFKETGGRTTTYGRLHPDQPAYTINTYFRRPNVGCHFHYERDRLITAREAMRFQALPDAFEVHASRQDERNALIGNAVPSLLAQAVAWSLDLALRGGSQASVEPVAA